MDTFMRSRLRRGKVGRVNTALLSNQAGLIVALRVCPHTKQWQLLLCAHTHYSPLCWPGSHRSSHNSPWMVPGSLLVLARHPFPRGSVMEEKAALPPQTPGLVTRQTHTCCRQSTFACDGKTCGWWMEGGGAHGTHMNAHERRYICRYA